jgi:hypothetical protein
MENTAENTGENTVTFTPEVTPQPKSKTIRFALEKLEGGFVSDAEGKRKVYSDANDVLDVVNIPKIVSRLDHAEYMVNISVIHKDEHQDILDLIDLQSNYKAEEGEAWTIEKAKEAGLIQVEKFDPNANCAPADGDDVLKDIKVTVKNAYSVSRLKSLPWGEWHDQLHMSIPEKAKIAGLNATSFYSMWTNMVNGKALYQNSKSRIGCTILAMYYERSLGVRTSTKEQCELLKENMLKELREIEILTDQKFVKSSLIVKKIAEMRKMLM